MKALFTALLLFISLDLFAANDIEILNPKIRLPPPGMNMTAMFFKIINHSANDLRILKISGDFAGAFELHSMETIDGQMKMRAVDFIELKKNSTTELKSGGFHVMIFNLKKSLKDGETQRVKLTLDNKKEIEINSKVENF